MGGRPATRAHQLSRRGMLRNKMIRRRQEGEKKQKNDTWGKPELQIRRDNFNGTQAEDKE